MDAERLTGVTAIAVLGVALTALFLGFSWFWMVFVIGYAVVVPIVAVLTGAGDEDDEVDVADGRTGRETASTADRTPDSTVDALDRLRDRYARGELTDEQFERKLDRLLETETLEDAREYAARTDGREAVRERE